MRRTVPFWSGRPAANVWLASAEQVAITEIVAGSAFVFSARSHA
jgi:hypothetical protein